MRQIAQPGLHLHRYVFWDLQGSPRPAVNEGDFPISITIHDPVQSVKVLSLS